MGVMEDRRRIQLNEPHIATATGEMVGFQTDVPATAKKCKVTIPLQQDGSGDPVAPGWTDQLFDKTNYDSQPRLYLTSDSGVTDIFSATYEEQTRTVILPCEPNVSYTATNGITTTMRVASFTTRPTGAGVAPTAKNCPYGRTTAGTGLTITTGPNDAYMLVQVLANADVTDGVTLAQAIDTLDVRKAPNVRAINHWAGITVKATNGNLWDNAYYAEGSSPLTLITDPTDTFYGFYGGSIKSWAQLFPIKTEIGQTLTVSADFGASGDSFAFRIYFYYEDGTSEYNGNMSLNDNTYARRSKDSDPTKRCIGYAITTSAGTSNLRGRIRNVMVSLTGETEYIEPPVTTMNVDWSQAAGELCEAKADVLGGGLESEWRFLTLDGTEDWSKPSGSGYFLLQLGDYGTGVQDVAICSHLVENARIKGSNDQIGFRVYSRSQSPRGLVLLVRFDKTMQQTMQEMKDYLAAQYAAGTPVQVAYKLAEPDTFSLTPQTFKTLRGQNYVWSDVGEIEVKYWTH